MSLTDKDLATLYSLACDVARSAGELLADLSQNDYQIYRKSSGSTVASQVVTEIDYKLESHIIQALADSRRKYDIALLSEEQPDDGLRLKQNYFWCIDPLDGTLPFTRGEAGYAISIALVSREGLPIIGVVYDPVERTLFSARQGCGAFKNGERIKIKSAKGGELTLPTDKSFIDSSLFSEVISFIENHAESMGYEHVRIVKGKGAVLNAIELVSNAPGLYFKLPKQEEGGGSIWDFAATACICKEIGFHVGNFLETELALNDAQSTFMNSQGVIYASDTRLSQIAHSYYQQAKRT